MRLSVNEKTVLVHAVKDFDPQARIYLFGSRVDDTEKGGDIDVLIFSQKLTFEDKLNIKARLFEMIDEQKIDLLIARDSNDPFVQMVFEKSLELT